MNDPESRPASKSVWIPIAVLLVTVLARCYALGNEGLWCDEAYTALTVRMPLGEMISHLLRFDDAPPFFYILEKLNTTLLGDSEAALRVVSVLAGILTVAVVLWLGYRRRSAGDRWAAAFMAVATTGIFHSRQARSYAVLMLLGTGLLLSARAMLFERRKAGPLLAICASLLCLTHHVGVILVLTSLALWPLGNSGRPRLVSWVLWHTPALAIWASLWIGASAQLGAHTELNTWIAHYWETHSLFLAPLYSLGLFLPLGLPASELSVGFATPGSVSIVWTVASLALGVVCILAAGLRSLRPRLDLTSTETRGFVFEIAFLALPLLALLIASLIVTPVYVLGRTDVLAYPAFALLIGRGLASLPRRAASTFLVFWGVMSLGSLAPSYGLDDSQLAKGVDRRLAESMVDAGLGPEDWIIHTFMTSPSIEYYLDRIGAPHQIGWFPLIAEENTASDYPMPADSAEVYLGEAAELFSEMDDTLTEDGDVWVFGLIAPATDEAIAEIRDSGTATCEQIGYPVGLLVYSLVGRAPVPVAFLYHQDWVAGERIVLRIPRRSWIPRKDLQPVEIQVRN